MTCAEAIKYLSMFPPSTPIVLGQVGTSDVIEAIEMNTYYPHNTTPQWVVVDAIKEQK